jgi:hypothetical protein
LREFSPTGREGKLKARSDEAKFMKKWGFSVMV